MQSICNFKNFQVTSKFYFLFLSHKKYFNGKSEAWSLCSTPTSECAEKENNVDNVINKIQIKKNNLNVETWCQTSHWLPFNQMLSHPRNQFTRSLSANVIKISKKPSVQCLKNCWTLRHWSSAVTFPRRQPKISSIEPELIEGVLLYDLKRIRVDSMSNMNPSDWMRFSRAIPNIEIISMSHFGDTQ